MALTTVAIESSSQARPNATPAPDPASFIRIRTTLPRLGALPPIPAHRILTGRLVLRPVAERDLSALHALRTQAEVMRWTATGRPDRDLEETKAWMKNWLPPSPEEKAETERLPSFNFAICLRKGEDEDGTTDDTVEKEEGGDVIGIGGCHRWKGKFGWPEVGYMIRREGWGKGLATEFLEGWLKAWDGLEREEVEIEVDERTISGLVKGGSWKGEEDGVGAAKVREQLVAITAGGNDKSQRVLEKCGFEWFTTWLEDDLTQPQGEGEKKMVELPTYRRFPEPR
ncbi:hypothetical protein VTJ83DRAFT_315 [Remersonia thermophila]|uniref:N-acetyltransferase domain-containing protein n=1 Tax=Remersonia thermophila TaxID=72144 RepID=A0ABR4DN36_9PEZI